MPVHVHNEKSSATSTPDSYCKRHSFNQDGQALTKGGHISAVCNQINVKFDLAYHNSENTNRLLGACEIIGVCLYGTAMLLKGAGIIVFISKFKLPYFAYLPYIVYLPYCAYLPYLYVFYCLNSFLFVPFLHTTAWPS